MPEQDTYLTLTPFGAVDAIFPPDGGCELRGPAAAVRHVERAIRSAADHRGMTMTLDSVEPNSFFHFCQSPGSGLVILEPFDVMMARLRAEAAGDVRATLDAVGDASLIAGLRREFDGAPTLRKLEIARAIQAQREAAATGASVGSAEAAVAGIETRFTTEALPADLPADWLLMNAPRPLVGTKTAQGEFVAGRFYAAIDPADTAAVMFIERNVKDGAVMVLQATQAELGEMAIAGSEYRSAYLEMPEDERWDAVQGLVRRIQGKPYAEAKAMLQAARAALVKPASAPSREAFEHGGRLIYPTAAGGDERWALQTLDNKGTDRRTGDELFLTPEQAMKEADLQAARAEAAARRKEEEAARVAAEQAAYRERLGPAWDYLESLASPMGKARATEVLTGALVRSAGKTTSRHKAVEEYVAQGYVPGVKEGKETLVAPDGRTWANPAGITKTGVDYARWLIARAAPAQPDPAVPAADPQRTADEDLLAQVIAGTHPALLEPELVEQLEAVFNRYQGDAAMEAKLEEAFAAYEKAALKAAEGI